jgi:hypothetical protein
MLRTAIHIKYLDDTSTRPSRLKASSMSARPFSATVSFDKYDCDEDRYGAALLALLQTAGPGWGDASEWVCGATDDGRVYVRVEGGR